jgi:hypothetical protein
MSHVQISIEQKLFQTFVFEVFKILWKLYNF